MTTKVFDLAASRAAQVRVTSPGGSGKDNLFLCTRYVETGSDPGGSTVAITRAEAREIAQTLNEYADEVVVVQPEPTEGDFVVIDKDGDRWRPHPQGGWFCGLSEADAHLTCPANWRDIQFHKPVVYYLKENQ